jgi:chemotaxis protein MotA
MFLIIGSLVVIGSVAGGYLMHGGHLLVLNQPSEFLIIGGAALGNMLIGTPPSVLKQLIGQIGMLFGKGLGKEDYKELLAMMYQLFKLGQQSGVMALESHFDQPAQSPIMSKYPKFLKNHHAVDFLADSIKVIMTGGIGPHDLEALMDQDLEIQHQTLGRPAQALSKIADALPGLGIVAAVLGVVITMESIDGPPGEIGHKVGAALVGTFLGILLSYGFAQPMAASIEARVNDDGAYEQCIKAGVLAMYKGFPPMVAIEFARRVLPQEVRPSFDETEQLVKGAKAEVAAA